MRKEKPRRRIRWGRLLILIFLILVLLLLILGVSGFAYYKYVTGQAHDMNIVLMGVDGREETQDSSRADSVMLIHIDKDTSTITTVSLPRDSLVYIPCEDNGLDKLTHAYSFGEANWPRKGGGRACTIKTVQNVFELDTLDNYMQVDFSEMIKLVDEMGGIDMVPTHSFCEMDENENIESYCFEEGVPIHMNGAMALAYARHRKSDSDVYRAQRQQEVIKTMAAKAKSLGLWDLYKFGNKALDTIDTNLSFNDLLGYADLVLEHDLKFEQIVVEGEDYWMYSPEYDQDIYYYRIDEDNLSDIIKNLLK